MFVRFTHGKVLNLVQTKGAKIHFNEISLDPSFQSMVNPQQEEQIVSSTSNFSFLVFLEFSIWYYWTLRFGQRSQVLGDFVSFVYDAETCQKFDRDKLP
jgi:hypothetical protein